MANQVSLVIDSDESEGCLVCQVRDRGDFIQCDECEKWTHYKCVKLTPEDVERIDEYYCSPCQVKDKNLITTWYGITSGPLMKHLDGHFIVESIIDYGFDESGERWFFVKWTGYPDSENSWISEYTMERCYDLLQEFILKHDLAPPMIQKLIGALDNNETNMNNWISTEFMLKEFQHKKETYFKDVDLSFGLYSGFKESDGLYFLVHDDHCYVLLYIHDKRRAYIADGGNQFKTNLEVAKEIRRLLKIRLISCKYNYQRAVDHCGTSAVMIGLEFLRAYKNNERPRDLRPMKQLAIRIRQRFHPEPSSSLGRFPIQEFKMYSCSKCSKRFRTKLRRSAHQKMCRNHHNSSVGNQ